MNIVFRRNPLQCLEFYVLKVLEMALSLVKYVLEILVFSLRSLPYLMDKGMDVCHSGLMQFAGWMMIFYGCSMSWTVSTSRCLAGIARSWMASMPKVLVQELRGKELQFGLMAVILVCITWFLALMNRNWMSSQWVKTCQTLQMTRLKKRCASRM